MEVPVSRIQLALNVDDLTASVAFYSKLFGAEPAKLRPGYANFAIAEPPLKLILMENPGQGGSLNHLGVEVADTDAVDSEQARLARAAGRRRGTGHDLLLCQAGQVLGAGHPQRGAVGDLHRQGGQRHVLGRRPGPGLGCGRGAARRRAAVLRRGRARRSRRRGVSDRVLRLTAGGLAALPGMVTPGALPARRPSAPARRGRAGSTPRCRAARCR